MKPLRTNKAARPGSLIRLGVALLLLLLFQPAYRILAQQDTDILGQLLVATPEMKDPRFVQSVIYIVKHDHEGTLGLMLNRPLALAAIEDVIKGFGVDGKNAKEVITVHYGGPVSPRQGFILHSDDVVLETSIKVKDNIAMTSDPRIMKGIANGQGPHQFLLMVGYAGWAPGQLETEIKNNSWFIIPADKDIVFDKQAESKWQRAMDRRRIRL